MILYRYISKQIVTWTMVCTLSLLSILWLLQTINIIELLINKGVGFSNFVYLTVLSVPLWMTIILPVSALLATIMVLNRFRQDREIFAMRSAGMSNFKIIQGPVTVGVIFTILLYINSAVILPMSFSLYKNIFWELRTASPIVVLQEGVFTDITKGLTIFIEKRNSRYSFSGIFVHDKRKDGKTIEIIAESGSIDLSVEPPKLVFYNGRRSESVADNKRATVLNFDSYYLELIGDFQQNNIRARDYNEMSINALLTDKSSIPRHTREMRAEGHHRLASPLLSITMIIIGAAAVLNRQYIRASSWKVICIGTLAATLNLIAVIVLRTLLVKYPDLYPALYVITIAPIGIGLWIMHQPTRTQTIWTE